MLERAGITTFVGDHEAEARRSMEEWLSYISRGRPLVIAKYAMSLDGKIATSTGESKWITGPRARQRVHELRATVDAIVVGVNTVIADDPQLTARDEAGSPVGRQPLRVVVDSTGRVPLSHTIVSGRLPGTTAVVVGPRANPEKLKRLQAQGNRIIAAPEIAGRVDLAAVLSELATGWDVTSVLVEGGATVLGSLFDLGLVDKVVAFVAPKLIGGREAPGPIGGRGAEAISSALALRDLSWERLGDDLMIVGYVDRDGNH